MATHRSLLLVILLIGSVHIESLVNRKAVMGRVEEIRSLSNSNAPKLSWSKLRSFRLGSLSTGFSKLAEVAPAVRTAALVAATLGACSLAMNKILWTPSRTYNQTANTVAQEYDAWEREGILEHYWGEHIHLGHYEPKVRRRKMMQWLPPKKNFIQAKYDFIDEMLAFGQFSAESAEQRLAHSAVDAVDPPSPAPQAVEGGALTTAATSSTPPIKILDVGCGIGGTSRYLAKKFGELAQVTGITLSPNQARRAAALAQQQGVSNADFRVMDALAMDFPDASFDYVWACESGEHMPDKRKYVQEMARVLKPGGRLVVATWCQREEGNRPFTKEERRMLDFLYSEWTHPHFISIDEYRRLMLGTGQLRDVATADWTPQTIASWLHSIWVGVFDPLPVVSKPRLWWKCFRDGLTLARMHKSFDQGLMQYGMMTAQKL